MCTIFQLLLIPQIPHLEYRGIAVSVLNTAPRGIAVFAQPQLLYINQLLYSNFKTSVNFTFATNCKMFMMTDAYFEVGNLDCTRCGVSWIQKNLITLLFTSLAQILSVLSLNIHTFFANLGTRRFLQSDYIRKYP